MTTKSHYKEIFVLSVIFHLRARYGKKGFKGERRRNKVRDFCCFHLPTHRIRTSEVLVLYCQCYFLMENSADMKFNTHFRSSCL